MLIYNFFLGNVVARTLKLQFATLTASTTLTASKRETYVNYFRWLRKFLYLQMHL